MTDCTVLIIGGSEVKVDTGDLPLLAPYRWRLRRAKGGNMYVLHVVYKGHKWAQDLLMHRIILGAQPGELVDHINHDTLDNRRCNLRICTARQNCANRMMARRSKSPYKGIHPTPSGKWVARANRKHLGTFDSAEEAARQYDAAAIATWGEFACINFPGGQL